MKYFKEYKQNQQSSGKKITTTFQSISLSWAELAKELTLLQIFAKTHKYKKLQISRSHNSTKLGYRQQIFYKSRGCGRCIQNRIYTIFLFLKNVNC